MHEPIWVRRSERPALFGSSYIVRLAVRLWMFWDFLLALALINRANVWSLPIMVIQHRACRRSEQGEFL